ncbi:MAG: hypothetical protein M3R55_12780, partial [Acidobacteriota bacterium]|nr:hypothetical protein [Acidobacteriota bacterium]
TIPWDTNIGGCESGFTIPDWADPDIIWGSCYGNKLTRWDASTRTARSVSPWMISLDAPPTDVRYRCHWTAPVVVDPFDHETVYYGCQVIFRTNNKGQSWSVISPDLSTQDPSKIVPSGGVVGDNLGQFYGEVVYAIAPSPKQKGLIWAGTNDGKIWYSADAGAKWNDVSKNIPGMAPWGTFTKIEPSHFDANTAYAVVDFHIMDNRDPHIYKTTDLGRTWTTISAGLPKGHPLDYALSLAENPNRQGMLFAGTGHGFYYSMDDGKSWTNFQNGLPRSPVTWVVVQKDHHDVVVSTYGRGLYILHDISMLEQTGEATPPAQATRLFTPKPGFRMARNGTVAISFSLAAAPAGPVTLEILDASGAVIRTQQVQARAGLNRATWNMLHEPGRRVDLRTTPPENPYIWDEPRYQNTEVRGISHWGISATTGTPIAAPGRYAARITVDGATETQPFDILKDPSIPSSDADLMESTKLQVRIRDAADSAAEVVNRIEVVRRQIEDQLKANAGRDDLEKALRDLDKKILDVELRIVTRSDLLSDDKYFVEAYKVYLNLLWLAGAVGTGAGDEAGSAEYKPRDAAYEIFATLEKELAEARTRYGVIEASDIPAFNKAMQGKLKPIQISK